MFQSEMSDLMSGISPELLLLGHEEEIENQVSEILLQDFNDFQKFALAQNQQQDDGFDKRDLMDEAAADIFYPSAKPSDITGQSLAATMATDKNKVLSSMTIPTNNANKFAFVEPLKVHQTTAEKMDSTTAQHNGKDDIQETQEVIEEIQDFLDQFMDDTIDQNAEVRNLADELLSEGQKATLDAMDVTSCPLANSTMNEEDLSAAEDLLDNLIHGNFTDEEIKELEQSNDTGYVSSNQPSFTNVSNVSEIITDDGQNIIIVIAPSSPSHEPSLDMSHTTSTGTNEVIASLSVPVSNASYQQSEVEVSDDESNISSEDSEWFPDNEMAQHEPKVHNDRPKKKPGRQLQDRTKSLTSSARSSNGRVNKIKTIQDRKERKKMQNVEAARRYRDKKKAEESKVGTEEKKLLKKNSELKETLSGIEGELNTIKKLMTELGLIKLVTPKSLRLTK